MAKTSAADLVRMTQILDSGIPLDERVVNDLRASCQALSLLQTGTPMENEVFDLESNGFGFIASIAISNNSPKNVHIVQYRLEQQWPEPGFHWLEDPWKKVPREDSYSFPKFGPEGLGRDVVLNHRLAEQGILLPGEYIEGLLCGVGETSIPDEYHHRQRLPMRLSVFDGRGNEEFLIVNLQVNREQKSAQRATGTLKNRGGKRRPLLECKDARPV